MTRSQVRALFDAACGRIGDAEKALLAVFEAGFDAGRLAGARPDPGATSLDSVSDLREEVCSRHGVRSRDMLRGVRGLGLDRARGELAWRLRRSGMPLAKVAAHCGYAGNAPVIHALRAVEIRMESDVGLRAVLLGSSLAAEEGRRAA